MPYIVKIKEAYDPTHPEHIEVGRRFEGPYFSPPKVGERFWIGDTATSTVKELLPDNCFRTHNSIYRLVVDEVPHG